MTPKEVNEIIDADAKNHKQKRIVEEIARIQREHGLIRRTLIHKDGILDQKVKPFHIIR